MMVDQPRLDEAVLLVQLLEGGLVLRQQLFQFARAGMDACIQSSKMPSLLGRK
ncbi:hypothetical protein UMZ34_13670 [Halopseudomonas pachastrellae]|nr:hypothetical protein UMZ34_13670 [Halopseudomonas pachastrellae]